MITFDRFFVSVKLVTVVKPLLTVSTLVGCGLLMYRQVTFQKSFLLEYLVAEVTFVVHI